MALACSFTVVSQTTPLWLRNAAVSPDGKEIAFTYKGDIYRVGIDGGEARQLTSHSAYDTNPVWSPDGTQIVFASSREGSFDLYRIPSKGGTPKRLTTNSASELPLGFLNDTTVIYRSSVMPSEKAYLNTFGAQTYAIGLNGGRPQMYASVEMVSASADKRGRVLYEDKKGYEDPYRKHEHSSRTGDVWLKDGDNYRKLTGYEGKTMNPVWLGSEEFAYVSDQDGTMNVWKSGTEGNNPEQLTKFTEHPVRGLSASSDGKTIVFSWDGELFAIRNGKKEAEKVNVTIASDDYDSDRVKMFRRNGATELAVAPDGKEVAFVIRGDLYVTSVKYPTTRRITSTDGQERTMDFSSDGKKIVYDSERDGNWGIYMTQLKDVSSKSFVYASEFEEIPLYTGDVTAQQPKFSPDGKKIAFLEDRTTLRVMDLASRTVTTALEGKYNYSYSDGDVSYAWSPDSRWLLISYIGEGGWNNADVALVKADGREVVDLTESGYSDSNPKWILDGKGIAYMTGKYGMKSHGSWGNQDDIVAMMLTGDGWDRLVMTEEEMAQAEADKKETSEKNEEKAASGKKKDKKENASPSTPSPLEFELDERKHRMRRLTGISGSMIDYHMAPDGSKLYYVVLTPEGDYSLMESNLKEGAVKNLGKGFGGALIPDSKNEMLFTLTDEGIKKIDLKSGEVSMVEFEALYDRHPSKEREYIYAHMLRQVKDKFYDVSLHGVDWDKYGKHYEKFLPHISNNNDFAILMSEVLGELNASHTGARYYGNESSLPTANLGAFFDENYSGDGLMVTEVIPRGPLSEKKEGVAAGEIIMSVNGVDIKKGMDYFPLLEGLEGKKTKLRVKNSSGVEREVTVRPISAKRLSELLYDRFVEHNQQVVDSISNGRIAYVHIHGMDSPSFRTVYDQLLGKYRNREAVVVDTRWNGGGWLHNDVAQLLGGKEYVRFSPRGQYIGSEPFSQWTKPSVMLVNEGNYSDAHGTPYTYHTLGLGKLVGAPVPGTMTAVWWETQIDPTLVFGIPQVTSLDVNGRPLENQQLNPDIMILSTPGEVVNGIDSQLEGAVKELLNQLDSKSIER